MERSSSVANFKSLLQCVQGMGVRPATYSETKFDTTVRWNSRSKLTM